MEAFAGRRMPPHEEKEILGQWRQAGHAKDFDAAAFVAQVAALKRQQEQEDDVLFPAGREVYVVDTDNVTYMSRGTVTRKSWICEMGMIWIALHDEPLSQRIISVNRCNLLLARPKTMLAIAGEEVIDGEMRYRLMSL